MAEVVREQTLARAMLDLASEYEAKAAQLEAAERGPSNNQTNHNGH